MRLATEIEDRVAKQWAMTRAALIATGLPRSAEACLSLRIPGARAIYLGRIRENTPQRQALKWVGEPVGRPDLHHTIYTERSDVGAIACGVGTFGATLADFGGSLPEIFDQQSRHLGRMNDPIDDPSRLIDSLSGSSNALVYLGVPVCLAASGSRLVENTTLFERCAKTYLLAASTGAPVRTLPWFVRTIFNRRLAKDQMQAAEMFRRGMLPEDSRSY